LIHFVHLDDGIGKRPLGPGLGTKRLQLVATNQQPLAIHAHLPGQWGGRFALGDAVQQPDNLDFVVMGPLQDRYRKQVETASACPTAIIEDRGPIALVDEGLFERVSPRTVQTLGVQKRNQKIITSFRIQEIAEWKIHRLCSLRSVIPGFHARS
jgi:hypothetical protein